MTSKQAVRDMTAETLLKECILALAKVASCPELRDQDPELDTVVTRDGAGGYLARIVCYQELAGQDAMERYKILLRSRRHESAVKALEELHADLQVCVESKFKGEQDNALLLGEKVVKAKRDAAQASAAGNNQGDEWMLVASTRKKK